MATIAQNPEHHGSGQLAVTTTAKAITHIVTSTGATTTYTATTVVDATAWDLSNAEAGDVIKTADGYRGIILSVDNGNDTLTLEKAGWMPPSGSGPDANVSIKPADGNAAVIHRVNRCKRIYLTASSLNGVTVYVRVGGDAPGAGIYTDYPLAPGEAVPLDAESDWLDLTTVWVIASSNATVHWIIGGSGIGGDVATSIIMSGSYTFIESDLVDGDTAPDVTGVSHIKTNNTAPTLITDFPGVPTGQGQVLYVHIGDQDLTSFRNDPTKLKFLDMPPGVDWGPGNLDDIIEWYHDGTKWIFKGSTAAGA